jgi:cytochrome c biogenesis protein CcmG/thiol:disulfide interchange protein DsbE
MPSSTPAPPRPYSYNAEPLAPIEQRAKAPSKGGLSGFATTIIIIMVCLLVGGGIYYFINRTGTAPTVNNTVDNSRLTIQDRSVQSTTETGATITWKTDKPASSQVIIRDSSGAVITKSEPQETLNTSHSVTVTGLKPNTTYFYTSVSKNANGIETTSEGKLTTAGAAAVVAADKTAPTISGVNVSQITKSGAIVTWATDEPATSQVKYTTVNGNTSTTPVDDKLTTTHSVTLAGLDSDTTYNYSVISVDTAGNEANLSADQSFTTLTPIQIGAKEGNRAPDFSLKDLNGRTRKLSAFSGQIVMINFWALWCAPCVKELPYVQAVSDNLTHGQVAVLAIAASADEQLSAVEEFIRDNQYTFPVMFDSAGVYNLYNVSTLPTTFFIDKEGIIRKIQVGSFQNQAAIESILSSLQ